MKNKYNWWYNSSNGVTYDESYQALLDEATAQGIALPSAACKTAQNNFLVSIKNDIGLDAFDQIKVLYTDAPGAFTDFNWVNPSTKLSTRVNNPAYQKMGGITNDVTNTGSFVDTGTLGTAYTQNNCENIIYYKNLPTTYGVFLDGTQGVVASSRYAYINPNQSAASGGTVGVALNDTAFSNATGFDLTDGLYFFGRTSSTQIFAKKGSGARVTRSATSNGVSPYGFALGGYTRDTGTGYVGSNLKRTYYLYTSGRLLTTQEEADFKTAWDNYLTEMSALATQTIGTIYTGSSWSNLNDFTVNGATVSASGGQLQFTGGANNFDHTLDLSSIGGVSIGSTMLNRWTQTIQFVVPTITASANWVGVGLRSNNTSGNFYDLIFRMDLVTGSAGVMRLYSGPSNTLKASTSAVTISAGDVVSITLTLHDGYAEYSGYNVTTASTPITGTYGLFSTTNDFITNTGSFAIFNGGSVNVNSWTISSNELTNPRVAIIGDSKTQGYNATGTNTVTSIKNAYLYKLMDKYDYIVNLGGSGDDSRDYIKRTYEVINWIQPQTVIIAGVSNDLRRGVSSATWQANISSMISQFQAAGIRVVFWTGFVENVPNAGSTVQTDVSTWANAGIGCDVWDSLTLSITFSDNVHPNNSGHATIAASALTDGLLP